MKCKVLRNSVKLEIIEKWLKDSDCDVRRAAMKACNGREVPIEIIEKWLKDSRGCVRQAAMNACNGREVLVKRTFNPPTRVYKKCWNGIIVVAEIPDDAYVRGYEGCECRASKAKIVDIFGDFGGEKIGISLNDGETCYFIGDEVEIDNFDMSFEECSTGFYFFCTEREARDY